MAEKEKRIVVRPNEKTWRQLDDKAPLGAGELPDPRSRTVWAVHEDMAVFNKAGEMVFASSSGKVSSDVKRFCASYFAHPMPPPDPWRENTMKSK